MFAGKLAKSRFSSAVYPYKGILGGKYSGILNVPLPIVWNRT